MSNITPIAPIGRPKGSPNKAVVRKTVVFREAITEQDIIDIAHRLMAIVRDPEASNSDIAKIVPILLRHTINTADVDAVLEKERSSLSEAQLEALRSIVKVEGTPRDKSVSSYKVV